MENNDYNDYNFLLTNYTPGVPASLFTICLMPFFEIFQLKVQNIQLNHHQCQTILVVVVAVNGFHQLKYVYSSHVQIWAEIFYGTCTYRKIVQKIQISTLKTCNLATLIIRTAFLA